MTITLITASFNSVAVIRTALESVLRQTWPEIEYLIIDGGSSDGTLEVIREYAPKFNGRLRWISEPDRGMYDAINKGIRLATGEVIGILNADDVLANDEVIEKVAGAFGSSGVLKVESSKVRERGCSEVPYSHHDDHVDVVFGDIRFVRDRRDAGLDVLRSEATTRRYSAQYWRPWMLQWGFMPPHPSVYIRRECFLRLGDYALDYEIAADYALLIRFLRRARLPSRYLPLCMVDMRLGGKSTRNWRSNLQLNREIVRGNREAGTCCCLPMLAPKYVFKVWEFVLPKLGRWMRGKRG